MSWDIDRAFNTIKNEADWVSLREYRENTQFRMARNGKSFQNSTQLVHGAMVEIFQDGHFAYCGTQDLSDKGIKKAFDMAKLLSQKMFKHGMQEFDLSIRESHQGNYQSPFQKDLDSLEPAQIQEYLSALTQSLNVNAQKIIDTQAWAMLINTDINYRCSKGSEWQQNFQMVVKDLVAIAKDQQDIQKRTLGLQGHQIGAEAFDMQNLNNEATRIGKQAIELLSAENCPTETLDVMIYPDQLYLQVHESIGHPIELDRILGDERNYAGWSFISPEDFGKLQYGSKLLNVTYDPTVLSELASFQFDDTGSKATREYIIKNGILLRGLGGLESQFRSNVPGVACARSTAWNRPPMDRMGNLNIEPGESKLDDMIASMERGVIMQTNRSWSIDDYRNKFQFGCEYAQLVEDGKVTKVLKNPNYRGTSTPFWTNLKMVGDLDTYAVWGSPYCGKGEPNQVIRVGHSTPICLFSDIEVFGGAQ